MDENGLPIEKDSDMKLASEYLQIQRQDYFEIDRKETDGPVRIGQSLQLGEDVYAVAYIYQLKRTYIENDLSDMEEESEVNHVHGTSETEQEKEKRASEGQSFNSARATVRGRFMFMWITQIMLTALLFKERVLDKSAQDDYK